MGTDGVLRSVSSTPKPVAAAALGGTIAGLADRRREWDSEPTEVAFLQDAALLAEELDVSP